MHTRREFLSTAAVAAGITVLPFGANAKSATFADGAVTVHPIHHASFVMETPAGTIYSDPVGEAALYDGKPPADLILVTHEHGDHFNTDTLTALAGENTTVITNPAVFAMLPEALQARAIGNGASDAVGGIGIDAIPAYNMTPERTKFHPKGRDNGYVLTIEGFRVYISGDTEDIPEMRTLKDINLAFVCMNLPFTMDAAAAASAVAEFRPDFVYPYHYQGRDGGTQDPKKFAELVGGASDVQFGDWYGEMS